MRQSNIKKTTDEGRRTTDDRRQTTDDGRRTTDAFLRRDHGPRTTEFNSKRLIIIILWSVVRGLWSYQQPISTSQSVPCNNFYYRSHRAHCFASWLHFRSIAFP